MSSITVWGMGALYYSPLPTLLRPLLAIAFGLAPAGTFLNFAYRTATDFTPRYYDKPFDLRQLESVDLLSSYGAGEAIAPLLVRCDVGGQDYGSHINARAQVGGGRTGFLPAHPCWPAQATTGNQVSDTTMDDR